MKFQDAERIQQSVLAPLERRALHWIAVRIPAPIHSDHLTLLGLGSMLAAGLFYWLSSFHPGWLWGVNLALALNWFGDSLDGTLARHRNCPRPRYGFYVDHMIDTFGAAFLLAGLAFSGWMTPWIAPILLAAYYMLAIDSYLAAHTLGTFRISFWKLSPTELRILLAAGNLVLLVQPRVDLLGREFLLFDLSAAAGTALLLSILVVSSLRNTWILYRRETPAATCPGEFSSVGASSRR